MQKILLTVRDGGGPEVAGFEVEVGSATADGFDSKVSMDCKDGEIRIGAAWDGADGGGVSMALVEFLLLVFDLDGFDLVANSCRDHAAPSLDDFKSSMIREPRSLDLPRVMMTFSRPESGRNFGGILSQVFRPMTTALNMRDDDACSVGGET